MDPSCSDCGHRASLHRGGGCKVLVFDRIDGARKDCACRRIYIEFVNEDSLGVSRYDLPFGADTRTGGVVAQPLLALHPRPHKRAGLIPVTVEDSGILLGYLRGDDVIETQGPCSILPANHPALAP